MHSRTLIADKHAAEVVSISVRCNLTFYLSAKLSAAARQLRLFQFHLLRSLDFGEIFYFLCCFGLRTLILLANIFWLAHLNAHGIVSVHYPMPCSNSKLGNKSETNTIYCALLNWNGHKMRQSNGGMRMHTNMGINWRVIARVMSFDMSTHTRRTGQCEDEPDLLFSIPTKVSRDAATHSPLRECQSNQKNKSMQYLPLRSASFRTKASCIESNILPDRWYTQSHGWAFTAHVNTLTYESISVGKKDGWKLEKWQNQLNEQREPTPTLDYSLARNFRRGARWSMFINFSFIKYIFCWGRVICPKVLNHYFVAQTQNPIASLITLSRFSSNYTNFDVRRIGLNMLIHLTLHFAFVVCTWPHSKGSYM